MKTNIVIDTLFGSILFASILANLIPGGDFEMKLLFGIIVFLIGEIAMYADIIIKKLEKLGIR